ncbi:unnamed protein product, partial [Iphiclides podalirius]
MYFVVHPQDPRSAIRATLHPQSARGVRHASAACARTVTPFSPSGARTPRSTRPAAPVTECAVSGLGSNAPYSRTYRGRTERPPPTVPAPLGSLRRCDNLIHVNDNRTHASPNCERAHTLHTSILYTLVSARSTVT